MGTLAYAAPETLRAEGPHGPELDVYGLAATLYHMLTFQPPYAGTPAQIVSALARRDPVPASRLRPGMPRDLQAILDQALARRPADRYRSAAAFEADLRAFLRHAPVAARPVGGATRLARRLRRSTAFWAAAAVALVACLGVLGVQLRGQWRQQRIAAYHELWAGLPANFTLVGRSSRAVDDPDRRAELRSILDRAHDLGVYPIPTLAVRAAFLLDQGEARAAGRDMRALAERLDTDYARAWAELFAALPEGARGIDGLDASGLPEPADPLDHYLAAYQSVRLGQVGAASELMAQVPQDAFPAARELGLLLEYLRILNLGEPDAESAALSLYDEVIRFEEEIGGRSVMTGYLAGGALYKIRRFEKALEVYERALEVAPRSHSLLINAGRTAYAMRSFEVARGYQERAIEEAPGLMRPYNQLIFTHLARQDVPAARVIWERAPWGESSGEQRTRTVILGEIETEQALLEWHRGNAEAAREAAARAIALFEEAGSDGTDLPLEISRAVLRDEPNAVLRCLLGTMGRQPLRWRRIDILLDWMPEEIGREETQALRDYLHALRTSLSKGDAIRAGD